MSAVCAAVSAAGVAAVRWKAGGEAVLGVPVGPRADGCVVSASVNRSARARGIVARMPEKVGFFASNDFPSEWVVSGVLTPLAFTLPHPFNCTYL